MKIPEKERNMPKTTAVQKVRCEDREEGVGVVLERLLRAASRKIPAETMNILITLTAMAHGHNVVAASIEQHHLERLSECGLIAIDWNEEIVLLAL